MVVALGGHAIVPRGAAGTADEQVATIGRAMAEQTRKIFPGSSCASRKIE